MTQSLAVQLRARRSEMMASEVEDVALRLFDERGFGDVTVEEIAAAAHISVRTFYRYFPTKEDVLQVQIDRRTAAVRAALSARPVDEPPLHSLRVAWEEVVSAEDTERLRRWISVIAATPNLVRGVLGGIQMKGSTAIAQFFGLRLGVPSDALVPTMLAAAAGGVIQAAQTQWFFQGGDLAAAISEGLDVLEHGIGTDPGVWSANETRRSRKGGQVDDEGVLDPWVTDWMEANPERAVPFDDLSPELLALARGPMGFPPTREIANIRDDVAEGVPVRIYRGDVPPTGLVVYFHGGGFVMGSIGLMDNVARELAHASGAVVVSVEYRLAPEHPYPEGLDDCETVTRWAFANAQRFGVAPASVAVAGESAGGNLAAAVALRLRDAGSGHTPAGQVLVYPAVAGTRHHPSREQFDGLVISRTAGDRFWAAYSGGRDLDDDPHAAPLAARDLSGLPQAIVVLGGCDMLRDEGRAYANRLREGGVEVEEVCYAGQPHGFVNFGFPAADLAFERIGAWLRSTFAAAKVG